jgi:tetratricopeptide (TPR) repeat protein
VIKYFNHISLFLMLSFANFAPGQGISPWVGQRVITKYKTPLRVGNQVVNDDNTLRIYKVEQANGDWLWLVAGSVAGWVPSGQVVPFDQAIDYYTQEIRANPGSIVAYRLRGFIWLQKGETDIALADFSEAIRLDPSYVEAYNDRGLTWSNKKEYAKAIADYNEAIRLGPSFAAAFNNRAWLWATCPHERFRDGKKAVESANRAGELDGWKEIEIITTLAASYAESGDFAKAVEWQENANKLFIEKEKRKRGEERLKLYKEKKPHRQTD